MKVAGIMLYNRRNLCKAASASYHLVQTPKVSSGRWMVGVTLVSPAPSGVSSLAQCFLKHRYRYLHAAVSSRVPDDSPDRRTRGPLELSKNPSPSFPECMKHSCGGELNPKVGLQEETQGDPGLAW